MLLLHSNLLNHFAQGVKVKSPKLRGEEESGEDESELNLKKPTPGISTLPKTHFVASLSSFVVTSFCVSELNLKRIGSQSYQR